MVAIAQAGIPDGHLDVCLFNGAIRNSEGEHMAHLLRQKSKVLVAFGSCACFGGIPGLANVAGGLALTCPRSAP